MLRKRENVDDEQTCHGLSLVLDFCFYTTLSHLVCVCVWEWEIQTKAPLLVFEGLIFIKSVLMRKSFGNKTLVAKNNTLFYVYTWKGRFLVMLLITVAQAKNCTFPWYICMTRYLVDPASSHMLVSKTKPCMSKNKPLNGESANGSLNQLLFIWWYLTTWITVVILELIHASSPDSFEKGCIY